jgi:radical SAM/Cys-rich protein
MNQFEKLLFDGKREGLYADGVGIIQVNVGLRCNQICAHCHLGASPESDEIMEWTTMKKVLDIAEKARPGLVDITGGAPELNPHLRSFIQALADRHLDVQVRTNLTALIDTGNEGLMEFLRDHRVRLVGSLPCYLEENVRAQRGEGVYEKSVEAIRRLNALGYGTEGCLTLSLVYNPGGAFLPGDQASLEADYKRELKDRFGITFTNLLTITNMPIGRFSELLKEKNRHGKYMKLLTDSFNSDTVLGLMCRNQISIGWDGTLYDCDFNLALKLVMNHGAPDHIDRWDLEAVRKRRIVTDVHCFGCTAGCGSSCGGAVLEDQACKA